jgi:membrane protease YdiL (CAAX protease family)
MPSRRALALELLVLGVLAAAFLVAFRGRPGYVDVLLAVVAVGFILIGYRRGHALWQRHGVDRGSYRMRARRSAVAAAAFTAASLTALLAVGLIAAYLEGGASEAWSRVANPRYLLAALLYLPWALLQQFVFQFYLLGRLLALMPLGVAVSVTALAFSAVHFPRAPVMAVTLLAGAVWALLYRRYRVLLPLAVSHALLGSALHYWVFGRDLLALWLGA